MFYNILIFVYFIQQNFWIDNYQRSTILGCKDVGIKNQSLWQELRSFELELLSVMARKIYSLLYTKK